MKRIINPPPGPGQPKPLPRVEDVPVSDISIARLIDDGLLALYREMRNILMLGVSGKLSPADARDLRDTIKLLFEIQEREHSSLKTMTDEQLKSRAKEVLDEDV